MKKQIRQFVEEHRNAGPLGRLLGLVFDNMRNVYAGRFNDSRYKSEHGQDKFVDGYFRSKRSGFYLEVGAHNGFDLSNTYFFQFAREWQGICLEPNKKLFGELVANRASKKCTCLPYALDAVPGQARFIEADFWGRLEHRIDDRDKIDFYQDKGQERTVVDVKTMQQVLELVMRPPFHIDYLSIDTEGNDLNVLKGINWDTTSFGLIQAENKHNDDAIKDYLANFGYLFAERMGLDDVFLPVRAREPQIR